MTAKTLLSDLRANGFSLSVSDGKLHVKPSANLTEQQRADIRAHKAELLTLLTPKLCERCSTPMQRLELGYHTCPNCHYQIVERKSGFWVTGLEKMREAA